MWLQDREFPPLVLPNSSDDLLIPKQYCLKTASIYEVFRRFKNLVRLTPFRLEDFCAALLSDEQSSLLSEIHIMLLKALLREEDSQATHFGPLDHKDSINISMYLLDQLTWPDVLKNYLESDDTFDKTVLNILTTKDYPYVSIDQRLTVLEFLTDQFLISTIVRDDLIREGPIHYDDHCRICHKLGDLLCCETCPAVFHLDCVDPPLVNIPTGDYQCNLCKAQQLPGVHDCISMQEKQGFLCRQEHLGYDRHGRKYWFINRRIFVETEDTGEIWYYSSEAQLEQLLAQLDEDDMELSLCSEILDYKEEIVRQMNITETITNKNKGNKKSYLDVENQLIADKIKKEREAGTASDNGETDSQDEKDGDLKSKNKSKEGKEDDEKDSNGMDAITTPSTPVINTNVVTTRLKTGSLTPRNYMTDDLKRKSSVSTSKDDNENELRLTRLKVNQISSGTLLFKLGMENSFKTYVNHFATNIFALNKPQRNEEKNKERFLSHEFSLTTASEFKWVGILNGTHSNVISTLRQTVVSLEQAIVTPFMHPHWPSLRKLWLQAVSHCSKPTDFAKVMIILQACIKSPVFANVWHEKLGHTKLQRVTLAAREEKKKLEKREKRERDDEEERNRLAMNFVKYSLGLKHQVAKQKGEEYRIHGQWSWIYMSYDRKQHSNNGLTGESIAPSKIVTKIRCDGVEKLVTLNPAAYEYLKNSTSIENDNSAEIVDSLKNIEIVPTTILFDKLNVSSALCATNRLLYPKIAKKSVLDDLLKRRTQLKILEEQKILNKSTASETPPAHVIVRPKAKQTTKVEKILQNIIGVKVHSSNSTTSNVALIPNLDMDLVNNLAKNIQATRLQFSKLNRVGKQYKCYPSCSVNSGTFSLPQVKTASCYSPLCLQKAKVKTDLLLLLRKAHTAGDGSKDTVTAIMNIVNRKPSILEQKLTEGKNSDDNINDDDATNADGEIDPEQIEKNILNALTKSFISDDEIDVHKHIAMDEPKNVENDIKLENVVDCKDESNEMDTENIKLESCVQEEGVTKNDEKINETMEIDEKSNDSSPEKKRKRLNDSISDVDVTSSQDDTNALSTAENSSNIEKDDENSRERRSSRRAVKNKTSTKTTTTTTKTTTKYLDGSEEHETNSLIKTRTKDVSYDSNKTSTLITAGSVSGASKLIIRPNRRFAATSKTVKREDTMKIEKEYYADGTERIYSTCSTRGKIHLSKISNQTDPSKPLIKTEMSIVSMKYPPIGSYLTKKGTRSIMALQKEELKQLARSGGRNSVNGFNHGSKTNMAVWPYPCSRPLFKTCWLYRTMNVKTLAAIASQLRILWCCLRWDDMSKKPPTSDGKYQKTTESEIMTMEILKHRISGRFSEKTQYLRRKVVIPLEVPKTIRGKFEKNKKKIFL